MQGFFLSAQELAASISAFTHFPERTPGRWNLISTYLHELLKGETNDVRFLFGKKCIPFDMSGNSCRTLYRLLVKEYLFLFKTEDRKKEVLYGEHASKKDAFKPLILLPSVQNCTKCGQRVTLRNVPSNPLVYTRTGTLVAAMFEGRCQECDIAFYYSYCVDKRKKETFFYDTIGMSYFHVTNQTVFDVLLLDQVENNITISATTFESRVLVYNAMFEEIDNYRLKNLHMFSRSRKGSINFKLNKERLEEAWFYWEIVKLCKKQGVLQETCLSTENDDINMGHRKDLELLCHRIMLLIYTMPNQWLYHSCAVDGCMQGYVTIDGNEKVHRPKCAAPKEFVRTGPEVPNIINSCSHSPVFGNATQAPSKYCEDHQHLERKNQDPVVPPLKLRRTGEQDYKIVKDIPKVIIKLSEFEGLNPEIVKSINETLAERSDEIKCGKKSKKAKKFHDKTMGIIAAVKPCGVIVNIQELISKESPTQAFLFLVNTFLEDRALKSNIQFRYCGYDRACDLHPYLLRLSRKGNECAQTSINSCDFLVDIFHCNKHTEPTCFPPNNPKCLYHPRLPKFNEISKVNTECAEQAFAWLSQLKSIVRNMSQWKFRFFLHVVIGRHNEIIEKRLSESSSYSL